MNIVIKRVLSLILTLCLILGVVAPITTYAVDEEGTDGVIEIVETDSKENNVDEPIDPLNEGEDSELIDQLNEGEDSEPIDQLNEDEDSEPIDQLNEDEGSEPIDQLIEGEELEVNDYATFLSELKVLEGYANNYAAISSYSSGELILNFIRTGVERYNDDNWTTLAGQAITEFTTYVAEQDAQNGTTAMRLRNIVIDDFKLPNGNQVDFGHMFGTMNIAYIAAQPTADLGGWAGDICDLLYYAKNHGNVPAGTVDEQADYILENCFGVDADDAFGMDDFYGDMDAIYLIDQMKAGLTLSAVMEEYFTASLSDADRSEYFMKNRFDNLYTKESVREAVYNAYSGNVGLQILESKRELTAETDLRYACCYAFADYVYAQAGDTLEEPTEPDPEDPTDPDPEDPTDPEEPGDNPYYSVFSTTTSTLAPGITQTIKYAYTADNKQIAYYLADVDVTREDVTIMAGYRDADPSKGWGMQRVVDQASAMNAKHSDPEDTENYIENFRAIVATNGAGFNMSTGKPSGLLVMNGKEWSTVNDSGFFAILKDGSAMIGTTADYAAYKDQIQEGISGFGSVLIKNGEFVAKNDGGRASRTAIGIKADGSVVMMVLDGRQEPFSAGGTMAEIAQIMMDAGCYNAINLDGGGSSTFAAKPEGSDEITVVNRPSDGYQRSVSTSLIAVSTASTSKEFSYANITSEYDYLTIGTSLNMTAVGVSESGGSAVIPEGATWAVSDETVGSINEDGVFTATANGDVVVQLVMDGEVIGKKTLHVVVPDALSMEKESMNVIYNQWEKLPLFATYQGNPVAFSAHDVYPILEYSNAGGVDGLNFYIDEPAGYRTLKIYVVLLADYSIMPSITINCYREDEAMFDFNDVTDGNRQFAWERVISNSEEVADGVFQSVDTQQPMELSYTFAMDMKSIEIPEKLADLTYMLPGADEGKTAWDFLLQLAERVSDLTTVQVKVQFDTDLELDLSKMKISNDFFTYEGYELDPETNTVTLSARWIDRTQSVDPESASSLCVLSGVKATPKDGKWDSENKMSIVNAGNVSYRIYLRASSLYSFACLPENQEKYDLQPFSRTLEDASTESGAYFGTTYANFEDKFTLSNTNRQGWYSYSDQLFYYVDNKPLTGVQLVPGYEDPENKYFYEFAENGSCVRTISGLIDLNGDTYYAIAGAPKTGWVAVSKGSKVDYYYFAPANGKAVDGVQTIDGFTYTFTDKILTRGQMVTNSTGTRYRWAGQWATQEWLEIDGKIYYARSNAYFATGLQNRYNADGVKKWIFFDHDGVWLQDANGLFEWEGETYLAENGYMVEYPGLVKVGDDYYYFTSKHTMIKDITYWISKPNGIVPNGRYTFGPDGKMDTRGVFPEEVDPDAPVKNGIVAEDGDLFYYVNNVKNYAGLIQIDGYYYYVNTYGQVKHDCKYWITKTNGLLPEKAYTFDAQGRITDVPGQEIVDPDIPSEPDVPKKNGILEEEGELYYYVDGVRTYAGLIYLEGYYYYVNTYGQVKRDCLYWPTKHNNLLPLKKYTFDSLGRITDVPVIEPVDPDVPVKNGIVAENDSLYYYVDGVRTYAGLIQIDGYYYYVRTSGELAHSCLYWPTKHNDLLPLKKYTFDEQGRITDAPVMEPSEPDAPVKNGIVAENGSLYYYVDGELNYAGLIYLDGYYYYVRTKGELAHSCKYWPTKHNDLLPLAKYTFDEQGRMVDPPV